MRAGSRAAFALIAAAVLLGGTGVSAHRLDEYLQTARIAIDPGRVRLELDLTPGVAVADAIVGELDRNHDGRVSPDEERAGASRVLGAIALRVDDHPLHIERIDGVFPELQAMRHGEGTIRLHASAALPALDEGRHRLVFENRYRSDISVYLANALVPDSPRVAISAQEHSAEQRDLAIDYTLRAGRRATPAVWVYFALAVACGSSFRWSRSRSRPKSPLKSRHTE